LGGIRELIGKGTLFSGLDLAFGPSFKPYVLTVISDYQGFLLAILPPGAFLGLAGLIAFRNWAGNRQTKAKAQAGSAMKPAL
jgi:Na+-translocating ferredoxin:NAD+ oxidoreductase subunit E